MAEGVGPSTARQGPTTRGVFEAYLERVPAPSLRSGQVIVVPDNLYAHRGGRVREIVEGGRVRARLPASLLTGPQPHRAGLLEGEGAAQDGASPHPRNLLTETMGRGLDAVSARGARRFFGHCGYRAVDQPP